MVTPSLASLAKRAMNSYKAGLQSIHRTFEWSSTAPLTGLVRLFQGTCHPIIFAATALLAVFPTGCSPRYSDMPAYWPIPTKEYDNYGPGRFKTSYLATQIDRYYRGSTPGPIGVTTFVNIDDLYTTSTFGRMYAEQLMGELAMHGFDVVELRQTDALQFLDSSGEFALSRDTRAVRPERQLAAIVVGTYVSSPERVYVNARLIDPASSLVLSAGSVEMSKTSELTKLLRGGTIPASLERIPVRHLGENTYPTNPFDPMRRRQWDQEESDYPAVPTRLAPRQQVPKTARNVPDAELPTRKENPKPRIQESPESVGDSLTNESSGPKAQ